MPDLESSDLDQVYFDVASGATKGDRQAQEDTLISDFPIGQKQGFAIVADGMGGHASGDIASAVVASEIYLQLKLHIEDVETASPTLPQKLRDMAELANSRVAAFVKRDPRVKGMGTTLVTPVLSGDNLFWISIGDSVLLLFRNGALRKLNKDHSMAPQIDLMVKTGVLDAEKAKDHPDRSTLTSVICGEEIAKIDCPKGPLKLLEDDIVVAASDGLLSLSNETIANILMEHRNSDSRTIVNAFMTALEALGAKDQDNASIVAIKAGPRLFKQDDLDDSSMPVLAMAGEQSEVKEIVAAPPPKEGGSSLRKFFSRGGQEKSESSDTPKEEEAGSEDQYYYYRGQRYKKE